VRDTHGLPSRLRHIDKRRVDEVVALLLLAGLGVPIWLGPAPNGRLLPTIGALLFSVPVAVRRRWPLSCMLVIIAALVARIVLGSSVGNLNSGPGLLPGLLLLFYGLGAFAPPRRSIWVLGIAVAASSAQSLTTPGQAGQLPVGEIVVAVLPYVFGRVVRARAVTAHAARELAEQVDVTTDLRAREAVHDERSRIARELHDVIAHSVSVMVIQAGAARTVMGSDPALAEGSLRSVERAGRDALAEMRRLLGVLDSERDPRALAPQPGLADIQELLVRARDAGLTADLSVDGEPGRMSPGLDLCAYRVVQEALTNAIKHAAPAHAEVCVRWRLGALELEVSDDGRGTVGTGGPAGGHGLAGMRERVALHGGTVFAGAGAEGGFTVRASLPLASERLP
jgi:signal transduction histidine kinase